MNTAEKFEAFAKKYIKIDLQVSKHKSLYYLIPARDCVPLNEEVFEKSSIEINCIEYKSKLKQLTANNGLNIVGRANAFSEFEYVTIKEFIEDNYPGLKIGHKDNFKYHFYDYFCFSKIDKEKYQELPVAYDKIYTYDQLGSGRSISDKKEIKYFLSLLLFLTDCTATLDNSPLLPSSFDKSSPFYYLLCLLSHLDFWILTKQQCQNLLQWFLTYNSLFKELVIELGQQQMYGLYDSFISRIKDIAKKETNSFLIGYWQ